MPSSSESAIAVLVALQEEAVEETGSAIEAPPMASVSCHWTRSGSADWQ